MISDWRGDRQIGPAPFWEGARDPLRFAIVAIALLAGVSVFVTLVKTWGHQVGLMSYIRMGSVTFGVQVAAVTVAGLFGPNKRRAVALGLIGGILTAVVWFFSLPLLAAFGIVMILPITPVNP